MERRVTLLTLDELTERVGMSVRNVRFYTTKGLVPPPIRRGRSRLLHRRPRRPAASWCRSCRATASRSRRSRSTSPGSPPTPRRRTSRCTAPCSRPGRPTPDRGVPRAELERRAGRDLSERRPRDPGTRSASCSRAGAAGSRWLDLAARRSASGLLDLGFPIEAALRRGRRVRRPRARDRRGALRAVPHHGVAGLQGAGRLAGDGSGGRRDAQAALDRLAGAAYEAGMDETRRAKIAKRAR